MRFKKYTKQRNRSIQGLRSLKDTLPKNIKKVIYKKGHVFSETLNNWRFIAGKNLFNFCYPKSFRNSNKFNLSTLIIMVKRGHEIDVEYSKKEIMEKINDFFGYSVVEKIKLISFEDKKNNFSSKNDKKNNVTNNKFRQKVINVKNEKIKKSLIELTQVFKEK